MASRKKILFICGSMNQTTMMHKISRHLSDHDCWFSPHYTDGYLQVLEKYKLIEWTVAGQYHQNRALDYFEEQGLQVDFRGLLHHYDLVLTCSDLVVPKNIRAKKIVLVQEGMTDPENFFFYLVKYLGLPRYIASTSTFGMSDAYVKFCVASQGYKNHFVGNGIQPNKIEVTGIPNFDNCIEYTREPFEHKDYVLVATSDARETLKYENRRKFIEQCKRIANGKKLIFKLHPNENIPRAIQEINRWAPEALVYHGCGINPMIAHCHTLITRFSTVVYIGIVLGKNVYSEFNLEKLHEMAPIQNGARSAKNIAAVCEQVLDRHDIIVPAYTPFPQMRTFIANTKRKTSQLAARSVPVWRS